MSDDRLMSVKEADDKRPGEKERQRLAMKKWRATDKGKATCARHRATWVAAHIDRVRELRRERAKRWWAEHKKPNSRTPEQHRARAAVHKAIRVGLLVKGSCQECGSPTVHAHHHHGYEPAHQLDVVWLCSIHHSAAHRAGAA